MRPCWTISSLTLLLNLPQCSYVGGFSPTLSVGRRTDIHPSPWKLDNHRRCSISPPNGYLFMSQPPPSRPPVSCFDSNIKSNKVGLRLNHFLGLLSSRRNSPWLWIYNERRSIRRRLYRAWAVLCTVAWLWLGSGTIRAAHASSGAASSTVPVETLTPSSSATTFKTPLALTERWLERTSPSLDQMVDRYVRQHLFDDDVYDPIESIYREAVDDATQGRYPRALREVTASALGTPEPIKNLLSLERRPNWGLGPMLTWSIRLMQQRMGWSESVAIMVLASMFVVAGPSTFLFVGMMIGGMSKRNMNRLMKQRYGDSYTVDASIRTEPVVEAPSDEEVDEDDDNDDDEDDDDDDDDNEDTGDKKNNKKKGKDNDDKDKGKKKKKK